MTMQKIMWRNWYAKYIDWGVKRNRIIVIADESKLTGESLVLLEQQTEIYQAKGIQDILSHLTSPTFFCLYSIISGSSILSLYNLMASFMDFTYSATYFGASAPYFSISLIIAEPTIAPSEMSAILFVCKQLFFQCYLFFCGLSSRSCSGKWKRMQYTVFQFHQCLPGCTCDLHVSSRKIEHVRWRIDGTKNTISI